MEFGLGFSDELLRTSVMVEWELMRPSWCPSPNADSILRATQDVQRELNAGCNLRDLNIIYNVMTTASRSNGTDGRLPWRNRGESTDRTRILQQV